MVYPQTESLSRDPPTNRTKLCVNTMNACMKTALISVTVKLLSSFNIIGTLS